MDLGFPCVMLHEIVKSLVVYDPSADSPSASLSACFSLPAGLEGEGEELRGRLSRGLCLSRNSCQGKKEVQLNQQCAVNTCAHCIGIFPIEYSLSLSKLLLLL